MNERILELAEQAGWMMGDEVEGFNIRLEKFAQLIVQECVKSVNCYEALNVLDRFGIDSEHFGVES